jgi:hypothetical protein
MSDALGLFDSVDPFALTRSRPLAKKTSCPITREQFEKAKAVSVVINGSMLMADPKQFSTGSLGWYLNGKTTIDVDGTPVSVQIGMNLTIVGSKELPKDEPAPANPTES